MAILGDDTLGSSGSNASSDRAFGTHFTTDANGGVVSTAQARFSSYGSPNVNAKLCLFATSGGAPTSRLAVSNGVLIPTAGGVVDFYSGGFVGLSLDPSTTYFLCVVYDGFATGPDCQVKVDSGLSGVDSELANGTFSYSSPPSTWPGTDVSYSDIRINAWLDYAPAASGGPAPAEWFDQEIAL